MLDQPPVPQVIYYHLDPPHSLKVVTSGGERMNDKLLNVWLRTEILKSCVVTCVCSSVSTHNVPSTSKILEKLTLKHEGYSECVR